ncbi:MAG: TetR/AcrR family transcriptional regulator [Pseudonocardia sp.]
MPPVSQRYRDARRRQIIDAARRCFAHTGLHGTSMHDVFAESGLSAGAVYGYFAGKDDLVAAIIEEVLAEIAAALGTLTEAEPPPPPDEVLGAVVQMLDRPPSGELARLAVQVWAEAGRSPQLRTRLSSYYGQVQARFATLVQRYQHDGILDPELSAHDLAQVLTALGPAFLSQRALLDNVNAETFTRGLSGLLARGPNRRTDPQVPQ